jgi:outer membrane lipoprotein SlyB
MKTLGGMTLILVALLATGCASGLGGSDYERADTRRVYEVKMATIEAIRSVKIEGTESGIGAAAGTVVGGVAGSNIGDGKGAIVGSVLGAVVGGLAGAAAEEGATRQTGLEITVTLDGGRTIAIIQADKGEDFRVGDRVRILQSGGEARVSR